MTGKPIDNQAIDQLFLEARTQNAWKPDPVSEDLLRQVYDLARMAPTSANGSPARFVMLTSNEAKERLKPYLAPTNVDKIMAAPVSVIIAHDLDFGDKMPQLFPAAGAAMKAYFASDEQMSNETAFRNGSLQGAYFIMAARALGLDCGPISGFSNAGVDGEFFPEGRIKSNFICAIGHGDPAGVWPRNPRLSFEEACQLL
ncbi:3-hydroxypropanoate dehydrogenase [Novosphingobium sp. CF614]|uniref:malonic semialdehyde reductase n=1 Tax=Novosphingobium sp. CF614 TaxID=1884364 RepID=UPI0008E497BB|nr:malonic semialdehyde reductase [Novosphingobium sp. CF614]SFG53873.1 3-hydroxypropanoate dehydrogenase [Novosphingobium sp. CF614]